MSLPVEIYVQIATQSSLAAAACMSVCSKELKEFITPELPRLTDVTQLKLVVCKDDNNAHFWGISFGSEILVCYVNEYCTKATAIPFKDEMADITCHQKAETPLETSKTDKSEEIDAQISKV